MIHRSRSTGTVTKDPTIAAGTTANSGYTTGALISGSFQIDTVSAYLNDVSMTPVPLPGALWLLGSGAAALLGAARRNKAKAIA